MGETTVTLSMVLPGTENLLNTFTSFPLPPNTEGIWMCFRKLKCFKVSKLVNRQVEREKKTAKNAKKRQISLR